MLFQSIQICQILYTIVFFRYNYISKVSLNRALQKRRGSRLDIRGGRYCTDIHSFLYMINIYIFTLNILNVIILMPGLRIRCICLMESLFVRNMFFLGCNKSFCIVLRKYSELQIEKLKLFENFLWHE